MHRNIRSVLSFVSSHCCAFGQDRQAERRILMTLALATCCGHLDSTSARGVDELCCPASGWFQSCLSSLRMRFLAFECRHGGLLLVILMSSESSACRLLLEPRSCCCSVCRLLPTRLSSAGKMKHLLRGEVIAAAWLWAIAFFGFALANVDQASVVGRRTYFALGGSFYSLALCFRFCC